MFKICKKIRYIQSHFNFWLQVGNEIATNWCIFGGKLKNCVFLLATWILPETPKNDCKIHSRSTLVVNLSKIKKPFLMFYYFYSSYSFDDNQILWKFGQKKFWNIKHQIEPFIFLRTLKFTHADRFFNSWKLKNLGQIATGNIIVGRLFPLLEKWSYFSSYMFANNF